MCASLDQRLIYAADSLICFPRERLPVAETRLAKVVERAFTTWPADWPSGNEGTSSMLIRMLPEQRKKELVEKVIELHESLCRLEGASTRGSRGTSTLKGDVALNGADQWEFLYWNLAHSDSAEVRATYVRYAQAFLPNFPAEALLEWPGRHGYISMNTWGFLPLERLRFSDEQWSMTQLKRIRARDDGFTGIGPDSHGAGHVIRVGDWAAEDIRRNGTWSAPIVVLHHLDAIKIEGHELAPGFSLIEGHNRISRMLNMPEGERREREHRVLVVTVGEPSASNG